MKKLITMMFLAIIVLTGCGGAGGGTKTTVGVSMPTKASQRWIQDGENLKKQLEELGYKVDLQFADDKSATQISQIENMITKGSNILIVAAIDGSSLTNVLKKASDAKIKTIAYDRLIMDTENVDYYASFDNFKVGELGAQYIVDKAKLNESSKPLNMELVGGSPDDNNAYFFYDGFMKVMKPLIDSGKVVIPSGQVTMDKIATLQWSGSAAQQRMDNILTSTYTDKNLDIVWTPCDCVSIGAISSIKSVGYGGTGKPMPIMTGQDADISGVKSIIAGDQSMTIFKDTRLLAKQAVNMVKAIVEGKEPEINDTKSYNNNKKVVPTYLLEPVVVDKDNYEKILIDSGYYTKADLGL